MERDIVSRSDLVVYVFESDVHGTHEDTKLFEPRQEIEQVVRGEFQLDGLDILRGKAPIG